MDIYRLKNCYIGGDFRSITRNRQSKGQKKTKNLLVFIKEVEDKYGKLIDYSHFVYIGGKIFNTYVTRTARNSEETTQISIEDLSPEEKKATLMVLLNGD